VNAPRFRIGNIKRDVPAVGIRLFQQVAPQIEDIVHQPRVEQNGIRPLFLVAKELAPGGQQVFGDYDILIASVTFFHIFILPP
jgi:hypothetical protein